MSSIQDCAEAAYIANELFLCINVDGSDCIDADKIVQASKCISDALSVAPEGTFNQIRWRELMGRLYDSEGRGEFLRKGRMRLQALSGLFQGSARMHPLDVDFGSLCPSGRHVAIPGAHNRGIALEQLELILRFMEDHCSDGWWSRGPFGTGETLQASKMNLYTVDDWIIRPSTVSQACSMVELLCKPGTKAQPPGIFVSHWWGEVRTSLQPCVGRQANHSLT